MNDVELERLFGMVDRYIINSKSSRRKWTYGQFRLFVEFLLNTGLRRSEAIGLKTADVDIEKGVIYLDKTKDRKMRIIPLNRRAKEILVFLGNDIFQGLNAALATHIFMRVAKKAELQEFKLHSLRHTFACKLIANGIDLYTVSKLLGHSDIKTTMIYAKVEVKSRQNAVDKLHTIEIQKSIIPNDVKSLPA